LRKDKIQFKVLLQPKDLKILPKEKRDEILNSKIYLDFDSGATASSI
jgi:hypothetical protein